MYERGESFDVRRNAAQTVFARLDIFGCSNREVTDWQPSSDDISQECAGANLDKTLNVFSLFPLIV